MQAFYIIFAVTAAAILIIGGGTLIGEWYKNSRSPILTVGAQLISKRTESPTAAAGEDIPAPHGLFRGIDTFHTAVFRLDSGEELDLPVTAADYGALNEGEHGILTYQRKRFLAFEADGTKSE